MVLVDHEVRVIGRAAGSSADIGGQDLQVGAQYLGGDQRIGRHPSQEVPSVLVPVGQPVDDRVILQGSLRQG